MSETPNDALARENAALRQQLQEAEELLEAIRTGSVDALAVQGPEGPRIYTLESADQSYRTLIEQMNEGALLLSEEGTVLYCNACLAGWLGRPLQEVMGSSFADFVPLGFWQLWENLLAQGWAGKSKGEIPLETAQGLLLPFSMSMIPLRFGELPVVAVIVTDLTAEREISGVRAQVKEQNALLSRQHEEIKNQETARQAVEQAAAEARRMLEGIPQIAWTANPAGENTYLNKRWYDYAGESSELPLADWLAASLHPEDIGPAIVSWEHSLRTAEALEVECRIKARNGEYRWMLGQARPSRNEQGEIIQWIGTYTDIHEHKLMQQRIAQTQQELRLNNEELLRVNVDLDNFIYTASHDLKQPINNIEGLLRELLDELPAVASAGTAVPPLLSMMQDSVDRFKRTIEYLTEVTKLQKEHEPRPAFVELAPVVADVLLDLAAQVQAAGIRVHVAVDGCPGIPFSEKNLRSVVYNLLSNAVKYRSPAREPRIWVQCRAEAGYLVLSVEDNGLGIPPQNAEKLFGMFHRFHAHVEGSGIGLYMVKRMLENAGGRIEVTSVVGEGSAFSAWFPY